MEKEFAQKISNFGIYYIYDYQQISKILELVFEVDMAIEIHQYRPKYPPENICVGMVLVESLFVYKGYSNWCILKSVAKFTH